MVDILLATYNGEKYIKKQIESILRQTYTDWHIYISDDGSKDATLQIIQKYVDKYSNKIDLIQEDNRGNAKDNFLNLLKYSKAEYCMFCDQDDVWLENKIELTLQALMNIDNQDIPCLAFTDLYVVDEMLNIRNNSFIKYQKLDSSRTKFNQLIIQNVITGCTVMINHRLVELALLYKHSEPIIMHDIWCGLIASCFGKIVYIDKPLIYYRQHSNNSVGAKNVQSIQYIMNKIFAQNDIKLMINKNRDQANEFMCTYETLLNNESKEILVKYNDSATKNKIQRILFYYRYRVLKCGILRKLGMIIWG